MPPFRKYLKGSNSKTGSHSPRRKAFQSSRLAEVQAIPSDGDIQVEAESKVLEDTADDNSIDLSEEDEIPASAVNPYNALLQSLNAQSTSNQHHRKRRRLSGSMNPAPTIATQTNPAQTQEDILDEVEDNEHNAHEQEEGEEEILSDHEEDDEDPMRKHLNIDDRRPSNMIQESKLVGVTSERRQSNAGFKVLCTRAPSNDSRSSNSKITLDSPPKSFKIKSKLQQRARKLFPNGFDALTSSLTSPIFNLQDILFCGRTHLNGEMLQQVICVHALDYVLKTRDRILKNTARLAKVDTDESPEYRDQGFTRPKVVVILPTRQACYRWVDFIVSLYQPEQQENRKRFNESFSRRDDDISEDKPLDFRNLFGGNDDDLFRIGIKFTRKTVKLFSQFYSSDMIFASPLGLRMAMSKKDSTKEDFDFLSSIEVAIVDQADALLQQNWEHIEYIFNHLNLQPKEHHDCDFSRVRNWYLDGNARYLRQTIILSSFLTPELNQIYSQHMLNVEGALKITPEAFEGAIVSLGLSIKQTFVRFEAPSIQKEPEARFKAFTTTVLSNLVKLTRAEVQGSSGILIFVPSYMDFVRLRNFMASSTTAQDISFGIISEYTTSSEVARARSHFASGRHSILLYSGRAHHFRRYKLKGVKKVIMYSLPDNPLFYLEVAGGYLARSVSEGLIGPEDANVRSLFCKWDILKLERIVGSKRVSSMFRNNGGETFDFV